MLDNKVVAGILNRRNRKLSILVLMLLTCVVSAQQTGKRTNGAHNSSQTWSFAVSGDSRNCGDVIMPAIASKVRADHASFYWHLGDFRAIYDFDQDYKQTHANASILTYEKTAWQDFIDQQLVPFGDVPLYLSLGNHETIPPKTRIEAIQQFADWFDAADIKAQRLKDSPADHLLRAYYHWTRNGVDFITLDNASEEQFDQAQMDWLIGVLDRDSHDPGVLTVVVGMHEALPDSLSAGHSMNESPQGTISGRRAYQKLLDFRRNAHKNVYLLASHSHFFMSNVYNTACRRTHPETVLPGWIVGTAGAVRYRLPSDINGADEAKTDVYGYLLGVVSADGSIEFQFKPLNEPDVPASVRQRYTDGFVKTCFMENTSNYVPEGPASPPNCP